MSMESIERFVRLLKQSPSGAVFNPWWQVDRQNDIGRNAPVDPKKTFACLSSQTARQGKSRCDWRSARLSRRAFQRNPDDFRANAARKKGKCRNKTGTCFFQLKARRTSKREQCPDGFSEPTATIVWSSLLRLGLKPEEFVLWNAFPWHSFDPRRGLLSNRMPKKSERAAGLSVLKAFLDLFPCEEIVALGNVAACATEGTERRMPSCSSSRFRRRETFSPGNRIAREG